MVRDGEDWEHPDGRHTRIAVYDEMLMQIMRDFPALPDYRTLTEDEIWFFYEGLRNELKERTKPKDD